MRRSMLSALLLATTALVGIAPVRADQQFSNPGLAGMQTGIKANAAAAAAALGLAQQGGADAPYVTATNPLFGAKCDGVTNDTAALRRASSLAGGRIVQLPPGAVCMVDNLSVFNGDSFRGGRGPSGLTTLRRMPNSTNHAMMIGAASNVSLIDLVLDGNRANETVGADNLILSGFNTLYMSGVQCFNAKAASGYGDCVNLSGGNDLFNGTKSRILDSAFDSNDANGLAVNGATNLQVDRFDASQNGSNGIVAARMLYPPSPAIGANDNLSITNGTASNNGTSGVSVASFITGGSATRQIWGIDDPTARYGVLSGITATGNAVYGLVWQGNYGSVMNNVASRNGFGGILFNAGYSTVGGNTLDHNGSYGLDAGGCVSCTILPNTYVENGTDLDVGGTINTSVGIGTISTSGTAVLATGMESAGVGSLFEYFSRGLAIKGGAIQLNSPSATGINLLNGLDYATVRDVHVTGGTCGNGFRFRGGNRAGGMFTFDESGNIEDACGGKTPGAGVSTASPIMTLPDEGDEFYVVNPGAGTPSITSITTQGAAAYAGKVRWVVPAAMGSPGSYDPANPPAITFSGGGCTTTPTGTALITNAGLFAGVNLTNDGAGTCSSAPSVAIGATTGSGGGAGIAVVGLNNYEGRIIKLYFFSPVTLQGGGNLGLASTLNATSGCSISLRGVFGSWYETGRRC